MAAENCTHLCAHNDLTCSTTTTTIVQSTNQINTCIHNDVIYKVNDIWDYKCNRCMCKISGKVCRKLENCETDQSETTTGIFVTTMKLGLIMWFCTPLHY